MVADHGFGYLIDAEWDAMHHRPCHTFQDSFPTWAHQTGPVIWGEAGTNGQHAFHQLLHQGPDWVPIDFILPIRHLGAFPAHQSKLIANCLAQSSALMLGMGPATLGAGVFAVVMLAFTGYLDSYDGFPIARRRWVQLALIVISSIPVFLLPPIAYLIGYYLDGPRRRS